MDQSIVSIRQENNVRLHSPLLKLILLKGFNILHA